MKREKKFQTENKATLVQKAIFGALLCGESLCAIIKHQLFYYYTDVGM